MLSDIIITQTVSVFLFIFHGWLTGLQQDKVVSALLFFSFLSFFLFFTLLSFRATLFRLQPVGLSIIAASDRLCMCEWSCIVHVSVILSPGVCFHALPFKKLASSSEQSALEIFRITCEILCDADI